MVVITTAVTAIVMEWITLITVEFVLVTLTMTVGVSALSIDLILSIYEFFCFW